MRQPPFRSWLRAESTTDSVAAPHDLLARLFEHPQELAIRYGSDRVGWMCVQEQVVTLDRQSFRQSHNRQGNRQVTDHATAMPLTCCVLKKKSAPRKDAPNVPVTCLEIHLSLKHVNPHTNGRRMLLTHPAHREMQKTALRCRFERGNVER